MLGMVLTRMWFFRLVQESFVLTDFLIGGSCGEREHVQQGIKPNEFMFRAKHHWTNQVDPIAKPIRPLGLPDTHVVLGWRKWKVQTFIFVGFFVGSWHPTIWFFPNLFWWFIAWFGHVFSVQSRNNIKYFWGSYDERFCWWIFVENLLFFWTVINHKFREIKTFPIITFWHDFIVG